MALASLRYLVDLIYFRVHTVERVHDGVSSYRLTSLFNTVCIHHDERVAETQVHLHPIGNDRLVIATTFVILSLICPIKF